MEYLTPHQEHDLSRFRQLLAAIITVDDMFPPDSEGVREPRPAPQPRPTLAGRMALSIIIEREACYV